MRFAKLEVFFLICFLTFLWWIRSLRVLEQALTKVLWVEVDEPLHVPPLQQAGHHECALPRNIAQVGTRAHAPLSDQAQPVDAQEIPVLQIT